MVLAWTNWNPIPVYSRSAAPLMPKMSSRTACFPVRRARACTCATTSLPIPCPCSRRGDC